MGLASLGPPRSEAADRPPKGLHCAGDHWTAWNPPTPAAGVPGPRRRQGRHPVGASPKKYHGDPYLWPQLWEKNQYVLDAHWIYPGDPAGPRHPGDPGREPRPAGTGERDKTPGEAPATPERRPTRSRRRRRAVLDAGAGRRLADPARRRERHRLQRLRRRPRGVVPLSIVGSEYDVLSPRLPAPAWQRRDLGEDTDTVKYGLSTGDIVYINGGRARGLTPGEHFPVIAADQRGAAPTAPRSSGVSTATSAASGCSRCRRIGDRRDRPDLRPDRRRRRAPGLPAGAGAARPADRHAPGQLPGRRREARAAPVDRLSKDDVVSLGEDSVVCDRPSAPTPTSPRATSTPSTARTGTACRRSSSASSPCCRSIPSRSVAKILESRYSIFVGDRLDPK